MLPKSSVRVDMTPQREAKNVARAIRNIPLDAAVPFIESCESHGRGLWCLIANDLQFVAKNGGHGETTWDDPIEYALMVRWVHAHQERVHPTFEAALAFVRSKLSS